MWTWVDGGSDAKCLKSCCCCRVHAILNDAMDCTHPKSFDWLVPYALRFPLPCAFPSYFLSQVSAASLISVLYYFLKFLLPHSFPSLLLPFRFLLPRSFLSGESPRLRFPIWDFLPLFLSSLAAILAKSPEAKFLTNKIAEIVFWHMHKFGGGGGAGGNDNKGGGGGVVTAKSVAAHPLVTTITMTLAEADKVLILA